MPELRTFEDYCIAVCREIRFSPDHAAIAAELTDHLQEHMEALLEAHPDMPQEEAQRQAIAAMGDPAALGHALDAVHNPRLGWFQIWFRRVVKLMTAVALLVALFHFQVLPPMFPEASHSLRQFYQGFDATVNYRPDLTFSARDYNVTVEEVIVLETSPTPTVVALLRIPHTPWIREVEFTNWPGMIWAAPISLGRSISSGAAVPLLMLLLNFPTVTQAPQTTRLLSAGIP